MRKNLLNEAERVSRESENLLNEAERVFEKFLPGTVHLVAHRDDEACIFMQPMFQ